ncbi:MAG: hypothetical protein P8X79_20265 [Reinekea sp.]
MLPKISGNLWVHAPAIFRLVPFHRGNDGLNSKHQTYSARHLHFQRCRHPSRFGQSLFTVRLREGSRSRVIYGRT